MDSAESFKNEKAGILDEVLKASNQEEVIHQNLKMVKYFPSSRAHVKRNFAKLHSHRVQVKQKVDKAQSAIGGHTCSFIYSK